MNNSKKVSEAALGLWDFDLPEGPEGKDSLAGKGFLRARREGKRMNYITSAENCGHKCYISTGHH